LKNEILAGTHEAQMCRNDELMPNDLLPIIKSVGTVKPINGPATYQAQGCFRNSIICFIIFFNNSVYILPSFFIDYTLKKTLF